MREYEPIKANWSIDFVVLLLLAGLCYTLFLGTFPLFVPDEGRYAEIAREMLSQHQYITPTLNGVVFFDKPPLYYWLSAFAMHLGGVNTWTARAAPALFGLLGTLGAYTTGRLLVDRQTGIFAAIILTTMPAYFLAAHYANCDLIVAVCLSGSLWSILIALTRENKVARRWWMLSAYICCALAILAKGLIGIVFPLAITGLFILISNRWILLKELYLLPGLILIAILVLPWFMLVSKTNADFLHYFFYVQHFQRFVSHSFNAHQPFWFYVPVVIIGALPWVFYLIAVIRQGFHKPFRDSNNYVSLFLWIWVLFTFVFFSIPTSKIIGYILPIFPPLAIMIARYLTKVHHKKSYIAMIALVNIIIMLSILPFGQFAIKHTSYPIASWMRSQQLSVNHVYAYEAYPYDLPVYLQTSIYVVSPNWQAPDLAKEDNWQGEFAYGLTQTMPNSPYFVNNAQFMAAWQSQQTIYVLIKAKYADDFRKTVGAKRLTPLAKTPYWWLVSNK